MVYTTYHMYTAVLRKVVQGYAVMPNGFMGNGSLPLCDRISSLPSFLLFSQNLLFSVANIVPFSWHFLRHKPWKVMKDVSNTPFHVFFHVSITRTFLDFPWSFEVSEVTCSCNSPPLFSIIYLLTAICSFQWLITDLIQHYNFNDPVICLLQVLSAFSQKFALRGSVLLELILT